MAEWKSSVDLCLSKEKSSVQSWPADATATGGGLRTTSKAAIVRNRRGDTFAFSNHYWKLSFWILRIDQSHIVYFYYYVSIITIQQSEGLNCGCRMENRWYTNLFTSGYFGFGIMFRNSEWQYFVLLIRWINYPLRRASQSSLRELKTVRLCLPATGW